VAGTSAMPRALYDLEEEEPETGTFLQLAMTGAQSNMIRGNWEKAGDLLQMAEPIARDRKKNLSYLEFLTLNGRLLEAKGLQDEAEETFLEMVEHSRDKSDVVYSKNLIQLAGFYLRQKKYPKAAEFFKKSAQKQPANQTEIRLKKERQKGLSIVNFAGGDIDQAINLMQSADSSSFNSVEDYLQVLDTEQKEKYLLKVQSHFDIANALYVASPSRDLEGYVYNNILLTKGLAFFSTRHIERFLDKSNHQDLKQRLKKIKAAKKEVEEKLLKQFPENDRLLEKRDSLVLQERDFMQHLMGLEEYKTFDPFNVSWEHVRASLDTGEVAVEFFHGPESPLMLDTDRYFACIVEKSSAQPEIVPLFKAGKLDELLKGNQGGKPQVNNLYQGDNRDELYNMIFEPLSSMLKDKDKVYLSLSGLLYQVSIPALTIDKPYEAEMLTSTRSLVNDLKKTGNPGRVVAMGDIEYDEVSQRARNDAEQTYSSQRNKEPRHYQNLPGTKKEITHIAQLLGEREIPVQVISGKNGTEEAFRNMEGMDTDIIHLAAHGFHYPSANSVVMMERLYGVDDYLSDITNPMLRSGLLFSKTNEKLEGDGVITANEIAAMDFSGVELVVLSTCQSGLGDVMGSEGVFGLQRAFKMAGVEKMIVSLWKVPDEATAELMAKFYDNYLSGDDANRALKKAQMTVREKYVDPFYWAGFCVVN